MGTAPTPRPSDKAGWALLAAALLVYALSFAWFYPPLAGVEDEAGFINQAFVWSKGALTAEGVGLARLPDFVPVPGQGQVSWRNPGRSLTLLPLVGAGLDRWIFATGAVIHGATVLIAAFVLRFSGASPLWAILLLCHPTLALYSRTVVADGLGGLFVLGAVGAALARSRWAWSVGALLGLAVISRYQAAVVVPFVLVALWHHRGMRRALEAAASFGVLALALVGYNEFLYARWLGPAGMSVGGAIVGAPTPELFALQNIWIQLPFYTLALLVLWPGQLLALAAPVGPLRSYACAVGLPVLALMSAYFFRDRGAGFLQDLVLGQRLLLIALPVWIVCYGVALQRLVLASRDKLGARGRTAGSAVAVILATVMLGGQVLLSQRHQQHLDRLLQARDFVTAHVPRGALIHANQVLHKLFWTYPLCSYFHWREIGSQRGELSCLPNAPGATQEYVAFISKVPGEGWPTGLAALAATGSARRVAGQGEIVLYRLENTSRASP